jgi:hypothetical protein
MDSIVIRVCRVRVHREGDTLLCTTLDIICHNCGNFALSIYRTHACTTRYPPIKDAGPVLQRWDWPRHLHWAVHYSNTYVTELKAAWDKEFDRSGVPSKCKEWKLHAHAVPYFWHSVDGMFSKNYIVYTVKKYTHNFVLSHFCVCETHICVPGTQKGCGLGIATF